MFMCYQGNCLLLILLSQNLPARGERCHEAEAASPTKDVTNSSHGVSMHQGLLMEGTVNNKEILAQPSPALCINFSTNSVTSSAPLFGQNLLLYANTFVHVPHQPRCGSPRLSKVNWSWSRCREGLLTWCRETAPSLIRVGEPALVGLANLRPWVMPLTVSPSLESCERTSPSWKAA